MEKFIILLSIVALASCSLLSDKDGKDVEAIAAAEQKAKECIQVFTNQEIERAKEEISNTVSSVISEADTTLTKKFQQVESLLNTKAEETKKELSGKISGIEDSITNAKVIGFIGIAVGLIGIIMAIVAYRKRPRTNVKRIMEIIKDEIQQNPSVQNSIKRIANSVSVNRSQANYQPQINVEQVIEAYINSKKFRDIIQQYVNAEVVTPNMKNEVRADNISRTVAKTTYQIFAKESNTMILSNIQDTYQKGKSIFRLTLLEPNAATAEVSVCIEQEEVKQRILKFDSQYLEPICTVTRSSNEPTEVVIKSTGVAERTGDDWKVIKPITVEIK